MLKIPNKMIFGVGGVYFNTKVHMHRQTHKLQWGAECRGRSPQGGTSRCIQLTGMAGSSHVTRVGAVTVEGAPGLRAFTSVLTIVRQTPKKSEETTAICHH